MRGRKKIQKSETNPGRAALERILVIDRLIRAKRYPNSHTLAEEFEVSERTVYGDKKFMCERLNAPIIFDTACGGWRYDGDGNFSLPSVYINEGDMLAVSIGLEVAKRYAGTPYESVIKKSLDKLAHLLPDTVNIQLSEFTSFAAPHTLTVDEKKLDCIYEAIRHLKPLQITYFTASTGQRSRRRVEPYHLHYYEGEWYLLGFDSKREQVRTFNVGRIEDLQLLDKEIFARPANFDAQKTFENVFGVETDTTEYKVKIRFDKNQAVYIRERVWHHKQTLTENKDGSVVLEFPAQGLGEVKRWVLRYGAHAKVLRPPQLKKLLQQEIQAMQKVYNV